MAYGYAHFWANVLTVLGTLFVLAGLLAAVVIAVVPMPMPAVLNPLGERLVRVIGATVALVIGPLFGGLMVVGGQSLRVLLAQRILLERLNERLRMARFEDQ